MEATAIFCGEQIRRADGKIRGVGWPETGAHDVLKCVPQRLCSL